MPITHIVKAIVKCGGKNPRTDRRDIRFVLDEDTEEAMNRAFDEKAERVLESYPSGARLTVEKVYTLGQLTLPKNYVYTATYRELLAKRAAVKKS